MADTYYHLAKQHRSVWTQKIGMRSFSDRPWWNHSTRAEGSAPHLEHQLFRGQAQQDATGILDVMGRDRHVLTDHLDVTRLALEGRVEPVRACAGGLDH